MIPLSQVRGQPWMKSLAGDYTARRWPVSQSWSHGRGSRTLRASIGLFLLLLVSPPSCSSSDLFCGSDHSSPSESTLWALLRPAETEHSLLETPSGVHLLEESQVGPTRPCGQSGSSPQFSHHVCSSLLLIAEGWGPRYFQVLRVASRCCG